MGDLHGGVFHGEEDAAEVISLDLEEVGVGFSGSDGGTPLPSSQQRQLAKIISFMESTHHTFPLDRMVVQFKR